MHRKERKGGIQEEGRADTAPKDTPIGTSFLQQAPPPTFHYLPKMLHIMNPKGFIHSLCQKLQDQIIFGNASQTHPQVCFANLVGVS
jgi:hypothetical protein